MQCVMLGRLQVYCGGAVRPSLWVPLTFHTPHTTTLHHTIIKSCRISSTSLSYSSPVFNITREKKEGIHLCWRCENVRGIHTTPQNMFWEKDPKGGYRKELNMSRKELIRDGLKELKKEISRWKLEMKEKFIIDPIFVRPGDKDKLWVLDSEAALEQWIVTCDSDHGEGSSSASLTLSPSGHGLFSGFLSTEVPKDGKVKNAGYCNMKTLRPTKSFHREIYLDWNDYNTLELRLRGDGRSYLLNISCSGYYDIMWNDIYSHPLYTRGGPHWQVTRIPFSKFFLTSKGRVQDKQSPIPLNKVVSLGITCADRSNAPFSLEIDYVAVYNDPGHTETFAYEMYALPKFVAGV